MNMAEGVDDFSRAVYCLLGLPVDNTSMAEITDRLLDAAATRKRFFLSTPNLNFVTTAQRDSAFRDSIIVSDLCPVDGMGALLLCKVLGLPIANRVAGSDIPAALAAHLQSTPKKPYNIAFFGGERGVAERACDVLNNQPNSKLRGVCAIDPGYLTPATMQNLQHVQKLNESKADFLLVALGAQKGQSWIMQNRAQIAIPAISHLGATINFIAGTVKRSPTFFQKTGLEWLWRIKEEPKLASRYYHDGKFVLDLLVRRVLPLAIWLRTGRKSNAKTALHVTNSRYTITLHGAALDENLALFKEVCRNAVFVGGNVVVDLEKLEFFDLHFAGLLLMLEKGLRAKGGGLQVVASSKDIIRALNLSGIGYLARPSDSRSD
jgi:N-acetylglucosaminyldiphosphoundecaprenol N-acetyl-beta-D-mannosaminyltransferase